MNQLPQKPYLIFLPGGNIDIRCFNPLLKTLSANFTVIPIDFFKLKTNSIAETVSSVSNIINSLDTAEVILVGHSFGADIAKRVENKKIIKRILMNSTTYDLAITKPEMLAKVLLKSTIAPILYPRLFAYYSSANFYLFLNLLTRPTQTIRHINQSMANVTTEILVTKPSELNTIICSNRDELIPYTGISAELLKQAVMIKGNHDWLMEDVKKSSEMITKLILN